ncbi:hypothetical protein BDB01DRAFT_898593 [Pilobolus umbonatus]|nr:hypothetical protein BDB01DRAFT_898593 [Pilobolus umbonatus]
MKIGFLLVVSILSLTVFAAKPGNRDLENKCLTICNFWAHQVLESGLCCCFTKNVEKDYNVITHEHSDKQYNKNGVQICEDRNDFFAERKKRQRSPDKDDKDGSRKKKVASKPVNINEVRPIKNI